MFLKQISLQLCTRLASFHVHLGPIKTALSKKRWILANLTSFSPVSALKIEFNTFEVSAKLALRYCLLSCVQFTIGPSV